MKIKAIVLVTGLALALAGCQTTKPLTPEEQARQDEYNRENDRVAKADCVLVEELNQRRVKAKGKPLTARDCAYLRKKDTLVGFDGSGPRVPNVAINGMLLPVGSVIALAQAAEKATNEKRAKEAKVPAAVKSDDGAVVYRKMLLRGYKEDEVTAVSGTAAFANAATATGRGRQYLASMQAK